MAAICQTRKQIEQEMRRKLEEEFITLTVSEAYYRCVSILSDGEKEGRKRGSPSIDAIRVTILDLTELPSPVRIMDFGGGTGDPMSAICKKLQALNKDVIVSVEEPLEESLQKYKKCVENLENANLDVAYSGRFQDYFGTAVEDLKSIGAYPQEPQDRVLAIQSFYHLTRWVADSCDPHEDIKRAVFAMYTILKPGGMLVIELDGGENDFISETSMYCFEILFPNEVVNFKRVAEARRTLLYECGIANILDESFPTFKALVIHEEIHKECVLPSLAEVGAYVTINYCDGHTGDTSKFDPQMLPFCMDFVQREGCKYGLSQEEDGMWRLSNVTHFITIKKVKNA